MVLRKVSWPLIFVDTAQLIRRAEFRDGVAKSSIRTYNADAIVAEKCNGVKFSSVFNTLTDFHVATQSLPP